MFAEGESRKSILITIVDDLDPEPDEMFEVILASPKNGAVLGENVRSEGFSIYLLLLMIDGFLFWFSFLGIAYVIFRFLRLLHDQF